MKNKKRKNNKIIIIISLLVGIGIFFGLPKIIENNLKAKEIKTLKEGYI